MHVSLILMTRLQWCSYFFSSPSLLTHSKCQWTLIELKVTWLKECILSVQFPRKGHNCFTFALSNILILWNCWIKKMQEWKMNDLNFKNGGLEMDETKLEQLFIWPISSREGVNSSGNSRNTRVLWRNLKADGKWMNQWKAAKPSTE